MKKITVDWRDEFANGPDFVIEGDPVFSESMQWRKQDGIHLRLHPEGVAEYFYSDGQPTHGYGGRKFEGELEGGERFCYKGAWSSRAGCVNEVFPETPVVDVRWGHHSTAIPVRALLEWHLWNKPSWGIALVRNTRSGEITVEPTRGGSLKNEDYVHVVHHFTGEVQDFLDGFVVLQS